MKKRLLVYLVCVFALAIVLAVSGCANTAVEAINITSANNATEIEVGKTLQLTATITPDTASQEVTWSTDDADKATVDNNGLVTAVGEGNVKIKATSVADTTKSKDFPLVIKASTTVNTPPQTIVLTTPENVTSIKPTETLKITVVVNPTTASQEVVWSTSNSSVATVNNGVVTAVAEGTAIITATAKDVSTIKNSITITVAADAGTDPADEYAELPFSTHDEYMAMENNKPIKVKGVVTYVLPGEDTISYYLQNGEDAYYIYQQDAKFSVEVGKVYAVGGQKTYYRTGAHEIKSVVYFEELTENITATPANLNGKDVSSQTAMNPYHGAVVTGTATVTTTPTIGTNAYSVSVKIGDKSTTLRIDPANMGDDEFAATNTKLTAAIAGTDIEFTGVLTHYGNGNTKAPQILVMKAAELTVKEASPEAKVDMVKNALSVKGFIAADANKVTLADSITPFTDVEVTWASGNTAVITNDGNVTHPTDDTIVTLTATVTHKTDATATTTREFKVVVAGSAFAGQKLATLDFEDAAEANNYGQSATKPGYTTKATGEQTVDEANTVTLGEKAWILTGTLISSSKGGDHCKGTFAGRISAKEGKVETTAAAEYNYVEFDVATYNKQTHGTRIGIKYKMENGEEWVDSGFAITVDSYELTTYRIKLAEGVKNISIYVIDGAGNVNIDNINLYK